MSQLTCSQQLTSSEQLTCIPASRSFDISSSVQEVQNVGSVVYGYGTLLPLTGQTSGHFSESVFAVPTVPAYVNAILQFYWSLVITIRGGNFTLIFSSSTLNTEIVNFLHTPVGTSVISIDDNSGTQMIPTASATANPNVLGTSINFNQTVTLGPGTYTARFGLYITSAGPFGNTIGSSGNFTLDIS
jgi:hypothetical protein